MSEPLSPIPTPPAQLWRQVRLQYLPVIVFFAGVLAAALIWRHWVSPPTLVAEVESIHADIRSKQAGALAHVKATPLQVVHAGDVLAEVLITDPRVIQASLSVARDELEVLRATMNPVMAQQRAALDYQRLLLDFLSERVKLASLKAQLLLAESNLTRTEGLYRNKMVTDERYDEVKTARDSLKAQVEAQTELVTRIEPGLKGFSADGAMPSPADGFRAALTLQEDKLRLAELQLSPVPLIAPMDGVITLVERHEGEIVKAGESIFQISSTHADRIIGYIRQPVSIALKPGMAVEVRTRTFQRHIAQATIAQVGAQLEPIAPTLLAAMRLPVSSIPTELGLRIQVNTPAGMALRPGEQVDLILRE